MQGELVTGLIDAEDHIATVDRFIIMNEHFANQSRNIRRNTHNISTNLAVARPRRIHVIVPQMPAKKPRHRDHDEGYKHTA